MRHDGGCIGEHLCVSECVCEDEGGRGCTFLLSRPAPRLLMREERQHRRGQTGSVGAMGNTAIRGRTDSGTTGRNWWPAAACASLLPRCVSTLYACPSVLLLPLALTTPTSPSDAPISHYLPVPHITFCLKSSCLAHFH